MARTDYFQGDGLRVLAHRGLWQHTLDIDENTLEAFAEALRFGATHIESDVHVTADGFAVLFHDDSLERVAGVKRKISDLTLDEVSRVKLQHGGYIPQLAEALNEFPDARFNLDLKSHGSIGPAVATIEAAAAHQRVLISSFSERRRQAALAQLNKPVATSASSPLAVRTLLAYRFGAAAQLRAIAKDLDALQVPPKRLGVEFADSGFVSAVSELGIEVHFWTINDPEQMRALVAMGAHGLVSDRADLAVKLL